MTERWLPVPGYEDNYEVSDLGRVRARERRILCSNGVVKVYKAHLMSPTFGTGGRKQVGLRAVGRKRITTYVHRLVLRAFVGEPPEGTECCHNNGIAHDNRLENLRWDTPSENQRDKDRYGVYYQRLITECPQGHAYSEENTIVTSKNRRQCRACKRARAKREWAAIVAKRKEAHEH